VQVKSNAVALSKGLERRGHRIVTGGTENHLVLWDVRPHGVTGSKVCAKGALRRGGGSGWGLEALGRVEGGRRGGVRAEALVWGGCWAL
jgi:hypothetical protein